MQFSKGFFFLHSLSDISLLKKYLASFLILGKGKKVFKLFLLLFLFAHILTFCLFSSLYIEGIEINISLKIFNCGKIV